MTAEVTVITPVYNAGRYLRHAVESVFKQTYPHWKMIIVDDASTDDGLSTIKDLVEDSRVSVIQNPYNVGQSKTQNVALQYVNTPYILMLDSDDWLNPDTIEILVSEAKRVPLNVALICGNKRIIYEDQNGNVVKEETRKRQHTFENKYKFILANYVPYPRFYRTSALRYVGGWPTDDPYEGRYLEDQRMDHRLIEHFKIHWVDHVLYNYRRHENSTSTNLELMNEMIEWNIRYSLKRWGNYYKPVFKYSHGWLLLKGLKKRRKFRKKKK